MGQEVQPQKALTGEELKKIVLNNVSSMLDMDGMLAGHVAYGRVAFDVTIKFHTNRPVEPTWDNKTVSRKPTVQELEKFPELGALETFPLKNPPEDAVTMGRKRKREITSPNTARIENALPIDVITRDQGGQIIEKKILYETSDLPDGHEPSKVEDTELTPEEVLAK